MKSGSHILSIRQPKVKSGIESELPAAMSKVLNCYGLNGNKSWREKVPLRKPTLKMYEWAKTRKQITLAHTWIAIRFWLFALASILWLGNFIYGYFRLTSWCRTGFLFTVTTKRSFWIKMLVNRRVCSWLAVNFHRRLCENKPNNVFQLW